jgi:hypothetical protein
MAIYPQKPTFYQESSQGEFTPFKNDYQQRKAGYSRTQRKQDFVKHSGAKLKKYTPENGPNKDQEMYLVTGWRLNKNKELISIRCTTTSKSKLGEKGWIGSIACTFTNTTTGVVAFHYGTMEKRTGKVVIDSMAIVINPKAKNGGYSGTYLK